MCRLIAVTCDEFISPVSVLNGLNTMKEGYDGSGVGMLLKDLGGPFAAMKDSPILSGIFSSSGIKKLDQFMLNVGFTTKYKITFKLKSAPPPGVPKRDLYLIRAYDYPESWNRFSSDEVQDSLMMIRLQLKKMGERENDMIVFTFWPDTITIKENGDPLRIAEYLNLDREEFRARIILAQGRQHTARGTDLYACHPFFLQGFASMANGENTSLASNRAYLASRGFAGYNGSRSDSEIFTHILHYTVKKLGFGVEALKHIITPLYRDQLDGHPDGTLLTHLKHSCRQLIVDGPNCVVGCLPDNTMFMVHDRKKRRPGIVGGKAGIFAFASEVSGLDAVIPDRDHGRDYQPMHSETAIVRPGRQEITVRCQTESLAIPN